MKRLLESTGNFDIENRCVAVFYKPDEEYDKERREEFLEENPGASEEDVESYIENCHELDAELYYEDFQNEFEHAGKPEGTFYEIRLKPGYYEGGSIDICEKDRVYSFGETISDELDDDFEGEEFDDWDDAKDIVKTIIERNYDLDPELENLAVDIVMDSVGSMRLDNGRFQYFLKKHVEKRLDQEVKKAEYDRMDAWLDKFADEHGLDDLSVSNVFSNGETWYSKKERNRR